MFSKPVANRANFSENIKTIKTLQLWSLSPDAKLELIFFINIFVIRIYRDVQIPVTNKCLFRVIENLAYFCKFFQNKLLSHTPL